MPGKYVRSYSKGPKNGFRDAEAIAEAVQRPTLKFVATKTAEQLDLQALNRVRERLVSQRTGIINAHVGEPRLRLGSTRIASISLLSRSMISRIPGQCLAATTSSVRALQQATRTVPIVFVGVKKAVAWSRPGQDRHDETIEP
jgi:Transposase